MKKHINKFVRECYVCQLNKTDLATSPGLLQPLPIHERVWLEISMDFIGCSHVSNGTTVIMVVVDRLSKYSHFIPLSHHYTVVQVFHGLPKVIVSDRDKVYLSRFWQ